MEVINRCNIWHTFIGGWRGGNKRIERKDESVVIAVWNVCVITVTLR